MGRKWKRGLFIAASAALLASCGTATPTTPVPVSPESEPVAVVRNYGQEFTDYYEETAEPEVTGLTGIDALLEIETIAPESPFPSEPEAIPHEPLDEKTRDSILLELKTLQIKEEQVKPPVKVEEPKVRVHVLWYQQGAAPEISP